MLAEQHRNILLDTAWRSIEHGLDKGVALSVDPKQFARPLAEPGASFVTLHQRGELRGCIGSLEAFRALIRDVAENAFAAAFRDSRFARLQAEELPELTLHISVLSPPEALSFHDEGDLLRQIRPYQDGLILQDKLNRGTFLPSVWESLPEPEQFLQQLKLKAGLTPDHWSEDVRVWRYSTESFGGKPSTAQG